jgi:hypothetical protein
VLLHSLPQYPLVGSSPKPKILRSRITGSFRVRTARADHAYQCFFETSVKTWPVGHIKEVKHMYRLDTQRRNRVQSITVFLSFTDAKLSRAGRFARARHSILIKKNRESPTLGLFFFLSLINVNFFALPWKLNMHCYIIGNFSYVTCAK